jgi:hypothetical protein
VATLDGTLEWIDTHRRIWEERFDKLDAHLRALQAGRPARTTTQGRRVQTHAKEAPKQ